MNKLNITETAEDFDTHPSDSKAHRLEANLGVVTDHGYHASSGKKHEILENVDMEKEIF